MKRSPVQLHHLHVTIDFDWKTMAVIVSPHIVRLLVK